MTLTVRELIEIPFLKTRVHAGKEGLDRTITWAHSCEMAEPWDWLEKGDLLMTVGMGVPEGARRQTEYIENLAAAGVSGLAIGENMLAPPLTDDLVATAERVALPVLITAYEVPFIQLSRTVAQTNRGAAQSQMVRTVRVYDSVRMAMARSTDSASLFEYLGDEIECDLWICIDETGEVAFAGARPLPDRLREEFTAGVTTPGEATVPGLWRIEENERTAIVVPVPVQRRVSLIAISRTGEVPAYAILQHVSAIAALEFERLVSAREELRRLGSETFAALLDRRLSPESADPAIRRHGLGDGAMAVIVASPGRDDSRSIHHALAERGLPHMLLHRDPWLYCLTSNRNEALARALAVFSGSGLRVGVSAQLTDPGSLSEAVQEGRWAWEAALAEQQPVVHYGTDTTTPGFRSISDARAVVDRVLGPVITYDEKHRSDLVRSLTVFMKQNRSWQKAAEELNVHKQTLVYRIRRVESLTGRRVRDTATIAEFWQAITAMRIIATSAASDRMKART